MARWIQSTLVLGAALTLATPNRAEAQTAPVLRDVYAAYMSGDYQAIARAYPTAQTFQDSRADFQRTLRDWTRSWQPSRAAFLLEVSFVAIERQWNDAEELLGGTRNLVVSRRAQPGTNPEEDAFELAFHRAAVTFFLGRQSLQLADAYLNALAGRVDLVPATSGKPRLIDPWMTLARGMMAEIQTAPALRPASRVVGDDSTLAIPAADTVSRTHANLAIAALERVRDAPAVAAEAAVRRGLLLLRTDQADVAIAAFDEADAAQGDATVRYWSALFRGRALERLDRHEDAAVAYERALGIIPTAQSPAAALASLWQRHDRPALAQTWARRAMTTPASALDPWWIYWRGDLRHANTRLEELRKARP